MKKRFKKREWQSSELAHTFAKIYGFEEKILAFEVKAFLSEYLDESLYQEIKSIDLTDKVLTIKIKSALLRNDFRMKKGFFLKKFQEKFGTEKFTTLQIF